MGVMEFEEVMGELIFCSCLDVRKKMPLFDIYLCSLLSDLSATTPYLQVSMGKG